MRSCLKPLVILVGLGLIVIALGFIVAGARFEAVGRVAAERALRHAFLTEVSVTEVTPLPRSGGFQLHGVTVFNPVGFKEGPAMEFETIDVDLDLLTVFTAVPSINRILVTNPRMHLRHELTEGTNLGTLATHASRFAARQNDADAPRVARRRFTIRELRCEGAVVVLSTNLLPASLNIDIAPFTMTDVSNDRPITTGEAGAIFIRAMLEHTLSTKGLLRPIADLLRREAGTPESGAEP